MNTKSLVACRRRRALPVPTCTMSAPELCICGLKSNRRKTHTTRSVLGVRPGMAGGGGSRARCVYAVNYVNITIHSHTELQNTHTRTVALKHTRPRAGAHARLKQPSHLHALRAASNGSRGETEGLPTHSYRYCRVKNDSCARAALACKCVRVSARAA